MTAEWGLRALSGLGLDAGVRLVILSRMEQMWPNLHCANPWAGRLEALLGHFGFSSCLSWAEPESADHYSGGCWLSSRDVVLGGGIR